MKKSLTFSSRALWEDRMEALMWVLIGALIVAMPVAWYVIRALRYWLDNSIR